jgi:hypothetical protein
MPGGPERRDRPFAAVGRSLHMLRCGLFFRTVAGIAALVLDCAITLECSGQEYVM